MIRKMAFHYVLAGHRLHKAGQKSLSLECYRRALPEYAGKNWQFAEVENFLSFVNDDHLLLNGLICNLIFNFRIIYCIR